MKGGAGDGGTTLHNHYGAQSLTKLLPTIVADVVADRIVKPASCKCGKTHLRGQKCEAKSKAAKRAWASRRGTAA